MQSYKSYKTIISFIDIPLHTLIHRWIIVTGRMRLHGSRPTFGRSRDSLLPYGNNVHPQTRTPTFLFCARKGSRSTDSPLIVVNTHAHVIVSVTRNFPRVIRTRQRYFFTMQRNTFVTFVTRRTKLRSTQEQRSLLGPCLLFSSLLFSLLQTLTGEN